MQAEEIIKKLKDNNQEYEMLLLLLFAEEDFAYTPINKPHFVVFDQDRVNNEMPVLSKYKDESFAYELCDGSNYNLISYYGDNVNAFIDTKGEFERGRRFFNHPEFLYGYITKSGTTHKYEVFYDRSRDNGIQKLIDSAVLDYIAYFDITSYEAIQNRIQNALLQVNEYGISKPANNLSSLFSKSISALGKHIKASHPVHCTKPALNCNNELVDSRIRSVIISQGQANFGRAFGILDKCCQL